MNMSVARPRMPRPKQGADQIVVLIDSGAASLWRRAVPGIGARVREAAMAALDAAAPRGARGEVAVRLSVDKDVRRLNREFRGKDKPTNVLSFPAGDEARPRGAPLLLGDIVIAYGTVAREAAEQGKPVRDHLLHLVVHGVLHLLGYDHVRPAAARRMETLETRILASLGISDPYVIERRRA
jgi:probable rRNA maturation factor